MSLLRGQCAYRAAAAASSSRMTLRATLPRSLHVSAVRRDADSDMMTRIKNDLKAAMKSKDSFTSTVLRSLLSEQQYASKSEQSGGVASTMASIIQKALSRRQDSAKQFRAAKPPREDLAEKEDREAKLIQNFLPEQISSEELEGIVKKAIDEAKSAGIDGKKMMGEVMKRVGSQVDKSRAPGAILSDAVRRLLQ